MRESVVPISKTRVTIGRGSRSITVDLPLRGDPEISRVHATLTRAERRPLLPACEGRNPTIVARPRTAARGTHGSHARSENRDLQFRAADPTALNLVGESSETAIRRSTLRSDHRLLSSSNPSGSKAAGANEIHLQLPAVAALLLGSSSERSSTMSGLSRSASEVVLAEHLPKLSFCRLASQFLQQRSTKRLHHNVDQTASRCCCRRSANNLSKRATGLVRPIRGHRIKRIRERHNLWRRVEFAGRLARRDSHGHRLVRGDTSPSAECRRRGGESARGCRKPATGWRFQFARFLGVNFVRRVA